MGGGGVSGSTPTRVANCKPHSHVFCRVSLQSINVRGCHGRKSSSVFPIVQLMAFPLARLTASLCPVKVFSSFFVVDLLIIILFF